MEGRGKLKLSGFVSAGWIDVGERRSDMMEEARWVECW